MQDYSLKEVYLHPPGHHFMEDICGEFITNSSVSGSNVAVVSRPRRLVPGKMIIKRKSDRAEFVNENLACTIVLKIKKMKQN